MASAAGLQQKLGKSMARAWQEHGKSMAREWDACVCDPWVISMRMRPRNVQASASASNWFHSCHVILLCPDRHSFSARLMSMSSFLARRLACFCSDILCCTPCLSGSGSPCDAARALAASFGLGCPVTLLGSRPPSRRTFSVTYMLARRARAGSQSPTAMSLAKGWCPGMCADRGAFQNLLSGPEGLWNNQVEQR